MESVFNTSPIAWAYGFHTEKSTDHTYVLDSLKSEHVYSNIMKVLSWFPLLSIISSIYECNKVANMLMEIKEEESNTPEQVKDAIKSYGRAVLLRSILQILFAPIFFVIDIIVTIGRFCSKGSDHSVPVHNSYY